MVAAVFGQPAGRLDFVPHAQRKRFQPEGHQVGVERRGAAAQVADTVHAAFHDEGRRAECLVEIQSVIPFRRAVDLRELAVGPVVIAPVDDHPAHGRAVAVDPFGRRVDDDVRTPFEGVAQVARGTERIVRDEGHVVAFGQLAQCFHVRYGAGGVAHALSVNRFRASVDQRLKVLGAFASGDAAVDAEPAQRNAELGEGAAVEERRGDDVVAFGRQREHGDEYGRHARRDGQRPHGPVQGGDALLVYGRGRVLQPGVNVAPFAQVEEFGGVFAALEAVCRRGIYCHTAGTRWVVGLQPSVDLQCLET